MATIRYVLSSYNSFSIINLSSVIFTTNTDCDIASSTFRNFNSDYNIFAFLSLTNSHINWSIILRSSNISFYSSISMITVTRVNNLNLMISRSHISNINNSSTINHSGIKLFISNLNSHITGSIITNNHNNSAVALINNNNLRSYICIINSEIRRGVISSVVTITSILNKNRFRTSSQVFNSHSSNAVNNFCSVFLTVNSHSDIASSITRNSNSHSSIFTLFNLTNSDINRRIILRTINNSHNSSVGMSIIT